ncbi:MAG: hypothetical protein AB1403_15955 [Candidatus Riflebacteria bacterium]
MIDSEKQFEQIKKTMLAVYSLPAERSNFIKLSQLLNEWDELIFPAKEFQGQKLFEDLQSLQAFLENRGLAAQGEEILRLILFVFPEKYFPAVPWAKDSQDVDYRLLEEAAAVVKSKNYPDFVQESVRLFNEQFLKIDRKLVAFALEVENFQFKENGAGEAGELFRRFADVADKLNSTVLKDMPWTIMNQLALKTNNSISHFLAAYLIVRGMKTIKNARPSPGLFELMQRNEAFFTRNHYWKSIDDDLARKDFSSLVQNIDKFLPMADSGYERSNLLSLRNRALQNINEIPRNFMAYAIVSLVIAALVAIILYEPVPRTSLNLDRSREELLNSGKKAAEAEKTQESAADNSQETFDRALEVVSRTGLPERKPPLRPHNRKLDIFEIRHVVFQKMRIDYLREQLLSPQEKKLLDEMNKDYLARCEFYEYSSSDREKVHWDAKIHAPRLTQDAQDILARWRRDNAPIDVEKLTASQLLSLNNPDHVKILIDRLKLYGYYREQEIPDTWNESAKRALLDFKVSNLAVVDSIWDMPTQKALFGH